MTNFPIFKNDYKEDIGTESVVFSQKLCIDTQITAACFRLIYVDVIEMATYPLSQ